MQSWSEIGDHEESDPRTVLAFGDIHATPHLLGRVFAAIEHRLSRPTCGRPVVICLGDLIDRGVALRETLNEVFRFQQMHPGVLRIVRGNHEETFMAMVEGRLSKDLAIEWIELYGGVDTLAAVELSPTGVLSALKTGSSVGLTKEASILYGLCCRMFPSVVVGRCAFAHRSIDAEMLVQRRELTVGVHGHDITQRIELQGGLINLDLGSYESGRTGLIEVSRGKIFETSIHKDQIV
ncbi:MAG: metallophosphoesterase [Altererythrobacter sp.]|nr:metallophosphoesterase [Altererythrobacter sp.]